jgi:hypothetical protein
MVLLSSIDIPLQDPLLDCSYINKVAEGNRNGTINLSSFKTDLDRRVVARQILNRYLIIYHFRLFVYNLFWDKKQHNIFPINQGSCFFTTGQWQ